MSYKRPSFETSTKHFKCLLESGQIDNRKSQLCQVLKPRQTINIVSLLIINNLSSALHPPHPPTKLTASTVYIPQLYTIGVFVWWI